MTDEKNDVENTPEIPAVPEEAKNGKDKKKEKKKKKQGPIRTGAVVPFIVFVALSVLFSIFLLDSTIKTTIEFVGGKVNGAEVNVGFVKSSFKDLKIEVGEIQFTNKNNPNENVVDVELMQFNLLWDALLRGKAVVELAEIRGILLGKKRTSPGEVYPEDIDEKTGNNKATQEALEKVEKEFEGNVFGDIAGVLAGGSTGDVSKNIEGTLESKKRFEQLNQEVKDAQTAVDQDLKKLPSKKDLDNLKRRFKGIRWKDLGNLAKAPKVLKEADKLNKDINKAIKSYDNVAKNTQKRISSLDKSYKEAEALISKDLNSVSKRMNLPTLDQNSIARMLFGQEVLGKIKEAKKYQTMAEKYMPPKKDKPAPIKEARGKGRDYQFGKPNSYPLFWLKLAKINSENEQGKIKGQIQDVTNDQYATGKLTKVQVNGDFPALNIRGVKGLAIIDHRKEPMAKIDGEIKSFLVKDKALSDSGDVKFVLRQSSVNAKLDGIVRPERADLKLKNRFQKIDYLTSAKSPAMDEVLKDVAKKTKTLTLDASVSGKWESLKFDIKSNLAKAIENSVQSLIKEKIEAAQRKIKQDIEKQIAGAKGSVDKEMSKIKGQYEKQMAQAKREMDKLKGQLKSEEKKAKKNATKNIKNPFKGIKL